jgi:uncharacterized protein YkwD
MRYVLAPILILFTLAFQLPSNNQTVCLSQEEMKLYNLLNQYRKQQSLKRIALSSNLTLVAQAHARDLADYFKDHPTGCNIHSWSDKGNWTPCCYTDDHTEASCMWSKPRELTGYEGKGYEIAYFSSAGANAEEGLTIWKKSTGHHEVIVNAGIWNQVTWNAVGVGIYKEYAVIWFGELPDSATAKTCE